MTQLILWILIVYGISNILVYGTIFDTPRNFIIQESENEKNYFSDFFMFLRKMLSCMMCTPTWVGFFFGVFLYSPTNEIIDLTPYVSWFFDGMLASGTTWIINSIVEWFEENRPSQS